MDSLNAPSNDSAQQGGPTDHQYLFLHHQSGFPVLPEGNKQTSLAKQKHHGCDQCGKCFPYMSKLKIHQRIHTGEKPYGCDQCGQHFSLMSSLKTHQIIHTGEKAYGCVECGKHFSDKSSLITHSESCISEQDKLAGGQYIVTSFMEEGIYGMVAKAINTRTCDMVAIKIIKTRKKYEEVAEHEMAMLQKLRVLDPDTFGIVRFHDSFVHNGLRCMVFESLDVDIQEFLNGRNSRLSMTEMRPIVQQLAITLEALKGIGLIHADIKLENIMLVNQREQPLKVKLIDFGLAVPVSETYRRTIEPNLEFRAPEVFLGLPLTEALDMWSLGCVAANVMLSKDLFRGDTKYDVLQSIFSMLGVPAQSLLDAGLKTYSYFIPENNMWRFKKPEEYYVGKSLKKDEDVDDDDESSLEEVFYFLEDDADKTSCDVFMDLLKRMLHLDPEERITPEQVLNHPFITTKPCPI